MPIVSAVVVVRDHYLKEVCRQFAQDPRVTVGEATGTRLPIVLESDSRRDDRNFWRSVDDNPFIAHHHVIFADVSDITQPQQAEVSQ